MEGKKRKDRDRKGRHIQKRIEDTGMGTQREGIEEE